jgi:CHAT domain
MIALFCLDNGVRLIAQADVPAIVGYRWVVSDVGAKELACTFYESLFSCLSIEDALFEARSVTASRYGRDDETWASPVLVVQTPVGMG